ncbi:MAG: hypothetical protein NT098_03980 [Candidatus Parcubacteria bacterium]|nr:hypothetical protein [Candidatus Parcubacteria bacterium]
MESMEKTQAPQEAFVQGAKSETVEKALLAMKELRADFELAEANPEIKKQDLALYEFPKMMTAIRAVEEENLVLREKGLPEFRLEETPEYKGMKRFGLTEKHMERQRELAEQYKK